MTVSTKTCLTFLALTFFSSRGFGAPVDFVREVRPIFEKHCYSCHGPEKQRSGFRLDIKALAIKGGDTHGNAIKPGNSLDSILIRLVTGQEKNLLMPPKGSRLSDTEINTLKKWIDSGAAWPDGLDRVKIADPRDLWSFKPVSNPVPPGTKTKGWSQNPIDQFILSRLEKEEIQPSPAADRITWLRRVYLDLTGLPPTWEQANRFLEDNQSNAFEKVVDDLLKSARYGERWAQHWLDVVRFADTHGFEVNTERPNAWPYRDYVIDAFNRDTPYDQFIREQIHGDSLGKDAATGFLVTASVLLPGQIGQDEPSKRLARQDALDEIVINTSQTFLGLSIGCARCHDHKFDPITQAEYYGMQSFFAGVEYGDRPVNTPETEAARKESVRIKDLIAGIDAKMIAFEPFAKSGRTRPSINARQNMDRFQPVLTKRLRFTINKTNNLEPCIDELEVFDESGVNVALASMGTRVTSSGNRVSANRHELKFIHDGKYGNSRSWMSNEVGKGWVILEFPKAQSITRVSWGRDREGKFTDRLALDYQIEAATESGDWKTIADSSDRLEHDKDNKKLKAITNQGIDSKEAAALKSLEEEKKKLETGLQKNEASLLAFAGVFRKPDSIHLLHRGDPEQPKGAIAPTFPAVLGNYKLPGEAPEQHRRKEIANRIASTENPLTARVMVNRIWLGHFGTGIVATPSDFGNSGTKPSHPELLDWLATEFVRSGWSIKHMHKLIVLSGTYRQSSTIENIAQAKDADVRLLWRYPSRRQDGESIRDSMLASSGKLNLKMGGRGFDLFDKRGGLTGFTPVESFGDEGLRRMIYAHRVRRERDGVFGALDCPDNGQSTAARRESTTPLQALNLFNSRFTMDQSKAFAERVKTKAGDEIEGQIHLAYQIALCRVPEPNEIQEAKPVITNHGLQTFCRVLFNSNEFLFLP